MTVESADNGVLHELARAPLTVVGQLRSASNASLLCSAQTGVAEVSCIYKPVAGERPLWDFPEGTLGHREVGAYLVSSASGWDLIPPTVWREDGPYGPGMCQLWIDAQESGPVDVVPAADVRGKVVVEGQDADGNPVALIHEDSLDLQRIAIFDAIVNNADRKGGHILRDLDERLWAIDHGVALGEEFKLRTVLWGWAGEALPGELMTEISAFRDRLTDDVQTLSTHLTQGEINAVFHRIDGLLASGVFPSPADQWPPLPWPVM